MSDIVERLNRGEGCLEEGGKTCISMDAESGCICVIAADTILALRTEVEKLREALEQIAGYRMKGRSDADIARAALTPAPDATARRGEQRTTCDDCGNSNLAHDRAVWTDDGASYCPTCRAALAQNGEEKP